MERCINILLVEDNPDHAEQISDALDDDFSVDVVTDTASCIKKLEEGIYDFLVLDYFLGTKENGLDILQMLNGKGFDLPKIVVTAYGNEDIAVEALKLGARDYVPKTLNSDYLRRVVDVIRSNLRRYCIVNDQLASQTTLRVLREQKASLFEIWRNRIRILADAHELHQIELITDELLESVYEALLRDITDGASHQLSGILQGFPPSQPLAGSFTAMGLVLIAFKDAARIVMKNAYPESFDKRSQFMMKIGQLVESTELEMSKRYMRLMEEARELAAESARARLKSQLIATLQHEIRQPLSYILNCAEDLTEHADDDELKQRYLEMGRQAERINQVLSRIERATDSLLTEYSDTISILDLSDKEHL